mgnify:CR=1 FL=1
MGRPLGSKNINAYQRAEETKPRQTYSLRVISGSTDGESYGCIGTGRADSGCRIATLYLGKPSLCLRCPFEECKLRNRKEFVN